MSVITCPGPGSGKTVLLRSWISRAGAAGLSERVARVPAGRDERDPQRFWLSVLAALRQTAPRLAAGAGGDGGALMCRLSKTGVWRGFDWQKQPHSRPSHPYTKVCGQPPGRRHHRTPPYARPMAPPDNCFSASGRNPLGNRAITGRSCTTSPIQALPPNRSDSVN